MVPPNAPTVVFVHGIGVSSRYMVPTAIRFVRKTLENMKPSYQVQSRQRHICGFDLLATRGSVPKELHVEVKGAAGAVPRIGSSARCTILASVRSPKI